jgi:hypothetical protein
MKQPVADLGCSCASSDGYVQELLCFEANAFEFVCQPLSICLVAEPGIDYTRVRHFAMAGRTSPRT